MTVLSPLTQPSPHQHAEPISDKLHLYRECIISRLDSLLIHKVRHQDGCYTMCQCNHAPRRYKFLLTIGEKTVFGAAVAPVASTSRLVHSFAWQWIQVLAFNLANQGHSPEEDRLNKPYRPIPSGRISAESTLRLRWIVVALGIIHSAFYSIETVYCALGILLVTYLYCDLRVDASHWTIRSCMGGFGFVPNFVGAALIAGEFLLPM